jgi:hypothetical protein
MVIIDPATAPRRALAPSAPPEYAQFPIHFPAPALSSASAPYDNATAPNAMNPGTNQKLERRLYQYLARLIFSMKKRVLLRQRGICGLSMNSSVRFGANQQDWNIDAVLDCVGGCSEKKIGQKAVAMCAHGDLVAMLAANPVHNFSGGFAIGKMDFSGDSCGDEFIANFVKILGIFGDFGTDGIFLVKTGGPSIGDVQKDNLAFEVFGQWADVVEDRPIGGAGVEGDQNAVIHGVVRYWESISVNLRTANDAARLQQRLL